MTRILTAAVLIPLIVWAVLWAPSWAFLLVIALVGLGAYREFDDIAAAQGIARTGWLGMVAGVGLLPAPEPALPVLVVIAAIFMAVKLGLADLAQTLPSVGTGLLGVVYIFGAWRCAMLLRATNPHWLMIALLVSWAGDTAAMYVGKAWGKRKLAPRVSPGKTWEGAVASVVGGTVAAVLYARYFLPDESLGVVMLVGAVANIAGQLGDLCESAFKRGAGVKDSGTMLPGHGGWLDRIDSTLFSVPAVYAVLLLR
ncbi:MAG: phosphatidate cytidylyltransferase [Bryobacteraceae bacterium]